jgi:hypothetical protein
MANSQSYIPEKEYTTSDGKVHLMSYGMFSDIMRILGKEEDTLTLLISNPNSRDLVVRRLYTEAKKAVENADELINAFEIPLSPIELDGLIAWVADHAMHFTMSTAEKTRPVVEKYQARQAEKASSNQ